jgi:hypothetical protein
MSKECIKVLPTCSKEATMEILNKDGKWIPFCRTCGRLSIPEQERRAIVSVEEKCHD